MTKYLCFQYSVAYCSHLSGSDVVLITINVNSYHKQ